jgi:hypothetical protein
MFRFLFNQHHDGKGISFGSKFQRLLGNTFFGRPEDNGLNVMPQMLHSFYFNCEDRMLPAVNELDQWKTDSILCNSYRRWSMISLGKGIVICGLMIVFALGFANYTILAGKAEVNKVLSIAAPTTPQGAK